MSEHEEFLAYAEEESRRTLADLSAAFASHFERALKVLTLLIGGAGAVAAYTVNNWSSLERPALWALLVLALGWSAIAAYLATWGMRSRLVSSGPDLVGMTNIYLQQAGSMQASTRADEAAQAMRKVRKSEINRRHQQTVAYATAVSEQTTDLRRAVVLAALSPALAIALWAVALWQM
ncbi:MAG: hypothetical protein EON49_00515 [Acidovorax sp.]|nr:MAG: hypothetical protein EON49_00515 [Acidovorax sp.]